MGARDSKQGINGPVLAFGLNEWSTFMSEIKNGKLDVR
jgi:hypothetical protein